MEYPELDGLLDDEYFVVAANMFKGEMPHEETSRVWLRKVIKKDTRDELARELKSSYGVNRVNFLTIEK